MNQKVIRFTFLMVACCTIFSLSAQNANDVWLNAGPYFGGILGKGVKDNTFDPGPGLKLSVGMLGKKKYSFAYSLSLFRAKNHVQESVLQTTIIHHVFEVFYDLGKDGEEKKIKPYLVGGIGAGIIKMENLEGSDNYVYLPVGLGFKWQKDKFTIDLFARVFGAFDNQFGQKGGYETGLLFGLFL